MPNRVQKARQFPSVIDGIAAIRFASTITSCATRTIRSASTALPARWQA